MADIIEISENINKFAEIMRKSIQSANINFLIGSGCSYPAIGILGDIENEIQEMIDSEEDDEAEKLLCNFLKPLVISASVLKSDTSEGDIEKTLENYIAFLNNISRILTKRKNNILPKQATILQQITICLLRKHQKILAQ